MEVKEKIFNHLKEKMGKTSLSERTLDGIATSFAAFFSDENAVTDEALGKVLSHAKSLEGQYSHDLSEGLERAKKDLAPATQTTQTQQKTSEIPKELQDRLDDYQKRIEQMEKERKEALERQNHKALSEDVRKELLGKGCQDNVFLKLALTQLDYTKDVAGNAEALKAIYDKEYSDSVQDGTFIPKTITVSGGSVTDEQRDKFAKETLEALRERHKI